LGGLFVFKFPPPPHESITSDLCPLFQKHDHGIKQSLSALQNSRYHERSRICQNGRLINIKENFCIYVYKHFTVKQEQKCEADFANNILHLSKITVGTPRHMPHHNTDYMLTRIKLTVTDNGLNYSFSYATK
jgi:hypothetical protein